MEAIKTINFPHETNIWELRRKQSKLISMFELETSNEGTNLAISILLLEIIAFIMY
jgi:hypothetical protein